MSSPITTHVLDTSLGKPAADVEVRLERRVDGEQAGATWEPVGRGVTNSDGRVTDLLPEGSLVAGVYQIHFEIASYYEKLGTDTFYPAAGIVFQVKQTEEHYHVPLLLNPFGYATYRGS